MAKRYVVSLLRLSVALALVAKRGGNPGDSVWDYCQDDEITEEKTFRSKGLAFAYARRNAARDMYEMPRVLEQVASRESFEGASWIEWESAGYWELDGGEFHNIAT